MVVSGKCVLIGTEPFKSEKSGKDYLRVTLAQNGDCGVFMSGNLDIAKLTIYKEYNCVFLYNARYQRMDVDSMKLIP